MNIEPATLARLSEIENIVGVKEASGKYFADGQHSCSRAQSFVVLSGDDAVTLPLIALGGRGVISVISNEIPVEFGQLTRAALNGDFTRARHLQRKYQALMEINFVETSPGPVKFAMSRMGLLQPVWRLPMVPPQAPSQQKIESVLESLGLLSGVHV